jgi:hypothetical protein
MKKILLSLFLICAFVSCTKDKKHCFECDLGLTFTGHYQDAGCYTDEEWNALHMADIYGNDIDKKQRCRKK